MSVNCVKHLLQNAIILNLNACELLHFSNSKRCSRFSDLQSPGGVLSRAQVWRGHHDLNSLHGLGILQRAVPIAGKTDGSTSSSQKDEHNMELLFTYCRFIGNSKHLYDSQEMVHVYASII
jgi:hypothetical protein